MLKTNTGKAGNLVRSRGKDGTVTFKVCERSVMQQSSKLKPADARLTSGS